MRKLRTLGGMNAPVISLLVIGLAALSFLLTYKLASLANGFSAKEVMAASMPVGWHGIYHDPLYLPLKLIRSVVFFFFADHGRLLTRLPNVLFGALTIISFAWLIHSWHSRRTAILSSLLFATSAWVLHASRLASFDVMYLWALPTLLLLYVLFQKQPKRIILWYASLVVWALLLYIPGLVWFVLLAIYLERQVLIEAWQHFKSFWQRGVYVLFAFVAIVPLAINLAVLDHQFIKWLGLPEHWAGPATLIKQFLAVTLHLFVRGPEYPDIWLGKAPILDIFTLTACVIGIYFYVSRRKAARSRLLATLFVVGWVLIGLGGPVSLSLLVPLLYIAAATGIAYLLHDWLSVFPLNPLARGLGLGLVSLAVALSCLYNLRSYFIAWPHNKTAQATFHYRR